MIANGADVVIVGAGSAGCVLARRLAERGDRDVLLLEAGPDPEQAETARLASGWRLPTLPDWGYASDGPEPAPLRRGRALGGSSWFTRFAVRGGSADFDAWAAAGNPGWSWQDVLPTFRAIESDAEFGQAPWHGSDGPLPVTRYPDLPRHPIHAATVAALERAGLPVVEDHNAPDAVGAGPMPMSTRDGVRVTSWDAWLPPDARPPRLEIQANAPVDRVTIRSGRAVGVRLEDGTDVDAALVILAAVLHPDVIGRPAPHGSAFSFWGVDPHETGWTFWRPGAISDDVMREVVTPAEGAEVYLCGEAFSRAQGWVEGALETAATVVDRLTGASPTER